MSRGAERPKNEVLAQALIDHLWKLRRVLQDIPANGCPKNPEHLWREIPWLIETCLDLLLLAEQGACVFPNSENREIRELLDELRDVYSNMESLDGYVMPPSVATLERFRSVLWSPLNVADTAPPPAPPIAKRYSDTAVGGWFDRSDKTVRNWRKDHGFPASQVTWQEVLDWCAQSDFARRENIWPIKSPTN